MRRPTAVAAAAALATTAVLAASAPAASAASRPYFRTPQAAARYLAEAYNRNETGLLRHVTNPGSRVQLASMRYDAVDLRLESCSRRAAGDYLCLFRHDFKPSLHWSGHGEAEIIMAPVRSVGWYMYALEDCD